MMKRNLIILFILWSWLGFAQDNGVVFDETSNKYGVRDVNGKFVIQMEYDLLAQANHFPHLVIAQKGKKWGILTMDNKIVLPIEYEAQDEWGSTFNLDGDAYFEKEDAFILKYKGKWGLIDYEAKQILPFEYEDLQEIDYSESPLQQKYLAQKKGKYGIITRQNKIIAPFQYTHFLGFFKNELAILKKNGKIIFLNDVGKEATDVSSTLTYNDTLNNRFFAVIQENNLYGVINTKAEVLIPCLYEVLGIDFDTKMFLYQKNKKLGLVHISGKEITPPLYDEIKDYPDDNNIAVKQGGKWGIIDFEGKTVFPCTYEEVKTFSEDSPDAITAVKKDGKYALITRKGNLLTEFIYTDMYMYVGGPYGVERDGKWGYIDMLGKEIIACQYDNTAGFFEADLAPAKKDGKYGFINGKGEVIVPFKYEEAERFYGDYAFVILNGKKGKIDKTGKEIW